MTFCTLTPLDTQLDPLTLFVRARVRVRVGVCMRVGGGVREGRLGEVRRGKRNVIR